MVLTGADRGPDDPSVPAVETTTTFSLTALGSGEVRYDWFAADNDEDALSGFAFFESDDFIPGPPAVVDSDPFDRFKSGTSVFNVTAGDTIAYTLTSTDSLNGSVIATISNFSAPGIAPAVPVPAALTLLLLGAGSLAAQQRVKRSARASWPTGSWP